MDDHRIVMDNFPVVVLVRCCSFSPGLLFETLIQLVGKWVVLHFKLF